MDDSRKRLIETAVRSFEDNAELKFVAGQLLEQVAKPEAPGAEEAIRRWEGVDGKKKGPAWRMIFPTIFLLVSAVIWADGLHTIFNSGNFFGSRLSDWFYAYPAFDNEEAPDFPHLTAEQRLLLFGDTSQSTQAGKIKALWDSAPDNPAYFAAYASEFINETKRLPPDFLNTARRIDPDNSWFTYVAAGVTAIDAVEKGKGKRSRAPIPKTPEWVVLDETRLNESLSLFRQASGQPFYHDPLGDLLKQQVRLLPNKTPREVVFSLGYIASPSSAAGTSFSHLGAAVAAKAWISGETGDVQTLETLADDVDELLKRRTGTEVTSILNEMVTAGQAYRMISYLAPAAEHLGASSYSGRLRTILDELERIKKIAENRKSYPELDLFYQKGGYISGFVSASYSRRLQDPPTIDVDDLTPGRLVDHEMLARFCAYGVWTGAMICLVAVWAYRFRTPEVMRRLASRAGELLTIADKMLVIALGVILPFFYLQALTRFTRLGGRDFSLDWLNLRIPHIESQPLPFVQWAGFLMLVTLASIWVLRWRLSKRAKALEFHQGKNAMLALATGCAIALIPVAGAIVAEESRPGAYIVMGLFAVPALWIVATISASLFINSPKLLQQAVVARALVPVFAVAALLAFSAVPFYKAAAFHWFDQDTLLRVDPEHPAMSKYEYECAVQMRKETRAILGYSP